MTDPDMSGHEHEGMDECVQALEAVHAFLHGELPESDADHLRHHLHACERCMESFEIESVITEMIRRSQPATAAPAALRDKLTALCLSLYVSFGKRRPAPVIRNGGESLHTSGVGTLAVVGLALATCATFTTGLAHRGLLLRVATDHCARCFVAPPVRTMAE